MFNKILIANRGEIACRVIKTARRMGIATVAVYSDADREALHVRMADEAIHIGAAPARESYLLGDKILDAALATHADAVHPGYGFLSENAGFAAACAEQGVVFIGPPTGAIEAMGSKSAAKRIMEEAGVPLVPGYHGDDQDPALLRSAAEDMGYPVLLKATAGGGGKGMRQVWSGEEFDEALAAAKRESSRPSRPSPRCCPCVAEVAPAMPCLRYAIGSKHIIASPQRRLTKSTRSRGLTMLFN